MFAVFALFASVVFAGTPETLPGTELLTWEGDADDIADKMMDGAHIYIERKIADSIELRQKYWKRDLSSPGAYEESVTPNRKRFMRYIGVRDERVPVVMQSLNDYNDSALVAEMDKYRVYQVRWSVLEGVYGEGLLLQPKTKPTGHIVALPDADQTPEQIVGLASGVPEESQYARRLVENGFQVVVPVLIGQDTLFSGSRAQTYREWIYRQAFHMGRHIIGYEVHKVLAVVDWFKQTAGADSRVGVIGYGEGGLISFYAAAVDTRIDASLVSGYFQSRQAVWSEPIYRNVWAFLHEFGDAEIAALVAPRPLVVEYSPVPEVSNQKGDLQTPGFDNVLAEFNRIDHLTQPGFQSRRLVSGEDNSPVGPGSAQAIQHFAQMLGSPSPMSLSGEPPMDLRRSFDFAERQRRQLKELEDHVQWLVRDSDQVRNKFFLYKVMPEFEQKKWDTTAQHETYPSQRFIEGAKYYRRYFWEEVIGKFHEPALPMNPRSRMIYDEPKWAGYEVVLDVFPDLFAWGYLLIPKDLSAGEKRPVVVCQHGRGGLPSTAIESQSYYRAAPRLAERGFIVFTPHNLYRGEDRYRWLDRKANGVKASLFSFILAQHSQILKWLGSLPFVDEARIGFYGKSYGGETAVRVPPLLDGYYLSICSGDFNDWTRKVASTRDNQYSFMYTIEWEMPYFDMGSIFSYAELVYLMIPRPFMVERGHWDTVAPDEWVAYEYAKVRWLYMQLGLADKTEIEFFNGGHAMNCEGTFRFLHKHLNWPEPEN
ncbi:dienelactone hydrolase family protein [Candidatus Poribacteria bacterium]